MGAMDTTFYGGVGGVTLATDRGSAATLSFGAQFDNFSIIPAPGAFACFAIGLLGATGRRRR